MRKSDSDKGVLVRLWLLIYICSNHERTGCLHNQNIYPHSTGKTVTPILTPLHPYPDAPSPLSWRPFTPILTPLHPYPILVFRCSVAMLLSSKGLSRHGSFEFWEDCFWNWNTATSATAFYFAFFGINTCVFEKKWVTLQSVWNNVKFKSKKRLAYVTDNRAY